MANEMRDRLVELFKKIEYTSFLGSPFKANLGNQFTDYALYSICDDLIENGVIVPQWISVKDRLPDKDGEYLCIDYFKMFKEQFYRICYFAKDLYEVDEFNFADEKGKSGFYKDDREYGYYTLSTITHWMPLPEPPKKEE